MIFHEILYRGVFSGKHYERDSEVLFICSDLEKYKITFLTIIEKFSFFFSVKI